MGDPRKVNYSADDGFFALEDQALQTTIYNAAGTAQDITGWTITFKMAVTKGGTAVVTKTAVLTTPLSGVCTISIASADWPAITADTVYSYTLARTDTGNNQVVQYGTLTLQTRPA